MTRSVVLLSVLAAALPVAQWETFGGLIAGAAVLTVLVLLLLENRISIASLVAVVALGAWTALHGIAPDGMSLSGVYIFLTLLALAAAFLIADTGRE